MELNGKIVYKNGIKFICSPELSAEHAEFLSSKFVFITALCARRLAISTRCSIASSLFSIPLIADCAMTCLLHVIVWAERTSLFLDSIVASWMRQLMDPRVLRIFSAVP